MWGIVAISTPLRVVAVWKTPFIGSFLWLVLSLASRREIMGNLIGSGPISTSGPVHALRAPVSMNPWPLCLWILGPCVYESLALVSMNPWPPLLKGNMSSLLEETSMCHDGCSCVTKRKTHLWRYEIGLNNSLKFNHNDFKSENIYF